MLEKEPNFQQLPKSQQIEVTEHFETCIKNATSLEFLNHIGKYINSWNPDELTRQIYREKWLQKKKELENG